MSERQIGRVVSVDNFRVFIHLDENLSSTYKSGLHDIYEIARINSYIIIPVGACRIVALITRVKMQEEAEFDKNAQSITLPASARYITATMLGTIETTSSAERFIQGVYNFPVLDNPVWYVTAEDLSKIFDSNDALKTDYSKDFYLPIGTSPAFPDYKVKICPDQLFVKHAAILGNTGSGKSCTLASILHSLFGFDFRNKGRENTEPVFLQNAHIVIFDTNGEYKNAFCSEGGLFKRINAYYIDNVGLRIPYWFMNWDDFDYLFEPGAGTQAPILKRAIGFAKNQEYVNCQPTGGLLSRAELNVINSVIHQIENEKLADYWKLKNYSKAISALRLKNYVIGELKLSDILGKIPMPSGNSYDIPTADVLDAVLQELHMFAQSNNEKQREAQIINDKNIDLPAWFNYQQLITRFIASAIDEQEGSNSRLNEYLSTLRLRLESFLNDSRIAEPLMLGKEEGFSNSLAIFLSFVLGSLSKHAAPEGTDSFNGYHTAFANGNCRTYDKNKNSQISILDMSLIPFDVLENLAGLIGRLIIEFVSHFAPLERGKFPIVLVLEEAQNYIPENSRKDRESIAKKVFERIAREGRKYGISLIICSQRPSELSKTVLSQCNSFIVHRLQNPEDQRYIKGLVSSANNDILDQLPILPQQHSILMGDCVRTPVQVKMTDVNPRPNSDNPKFIEEWLKPPNSDFPDFIEICRKWEVGER